MVRTKLAHDMCPPLTNQRYRSALAAAWWWPMTPGFSRLQRGVCAGTGAKVLGAEVWGVGVGLPPSPSLPPGAESALLSTVGQDTHECSPRHPLPAHPQVWSSVEKCADPT